MRTRRSHGGAARERHGADPRLRGPARAIIYQLLLVRLRRPLLVASAAFVLTLGGVLLMTAAVPSARVWALQAGGRWVVDQDALSPRDSERAEVAVIAMDAGTAGVLEAADLVREGVVSRVAVFSYPRNIADLELRRRGVHVEDMTERSSRVLQSMGVSTVDIVEAPDGSTQAQSLVLPPWFDQQRIQVAILVTASDHSRRVGRVLRRAMRGHPTRIVVRAARYSPFDPDDWWRTNAGRRTWIVEAQKLLLDLLRHPTLV